MWCDYYKTIVNMLEWMQMTYLFSKILCHGITTKPGSVVVSQADPHSWILQNDPIHPLDSWDPSEISNLGIFLTDNHTTLVWLHYPTPS